ncbi:Transcription factor like [Actinidia chinensis var. chinensis]|uniref:Transcription factor like n=1 Tax=Actinidia chinensis var. chinensis TaxID=1590841 RepID=A0A2R6QQU8_ACTCC|nr:Transcription factor like [Actinidia chinensis var. chinensis]
MKPARFHQEKEEDEEPPPSNNKDGMNDKASATRSKHSVTEQRRRSKINERFQMLRDLIPHSDQKRDTASFLLEVIEYVQHLQEKVQKYEGSHQGWGSEPTKLMPWRNSHWRVQNFIGHPQAIKSGSGPGSTFTGRFDENNVNVSPTIHPNQQNPIESDSSGDPSGKIVDQQPELADKSIAMPIPMPLQATVPAPMQVDTVLPHPLQRPISDAQSMECPIMSDSLNQQDDLMIEGGTISVTSVYSQGLLNNLTQALQTAGVDLSLATISVQIDLGKRANRGLISGIPNVKDPENTVPHQPIGHFRDVSNGDDVGQVQKRLKI